MADIEPEFVQGARRRSGSLSDPDSPCNSTIRPNSGSNRSPSLITDTELVSSLSNPDLSRTSNGYIETPIGRGISTRLQVRGGNGNAELRSQRAAKSCTNLITDIDGASSLASSVDNMAGNEPVFGKGARRRSGSLSDTDSLCSSTLKPKPGSNRLPSLITDIELVSSISNPDLSCTSNGYNETPIGRGISTRLQVRGGKGNAEFKSQHATQSCTNLITDLEQWLLMIKMLDLEDIAISRSTVYRKSQV